MQIEVGRIRNIPNEKRPQKKCPIYSKAREILFNTIQNNDKSFETKAPVDKFNEIMKSYQKEREEIFSNVSQRQGVLSCTINIMYIVIAVPQHLSCVNLQVINSAIFF